MPDPHLRILVFDLPPLLRELVGRALEANADMTSLVAEAGELETAVAAQRPDAVIVPLDPDGLLPESRRFLQDHARLRVLGLGIRDGNAVLYGLRLNRSDIGEVAPDQLPLLIRTALLEEATV